MHALAPWARQPDARTCYALNGEEARAGDVVGPIRGCLGGREHAGCACSVGQRLYDRLQPAAWPVDKIGMDGCHPQYTDAG